MKQHISKFPADGDSPLFLKKVAGRLVPIEYQEVLGFLKKMSQNIGKDAADVGLHSLRRTGSFFMHVLGVPLEDIKCVDDWKSLAALMYLISPLERKQDIDRIVTLAMSTYG